MGNRTTGTVFRKRILPALLTAAVTLCMNSILSRPVGAMELLFSSKTYGLLYERELAGGKTDRYAPLYESLSMDAANVGDKPLFFHFSGWGRFDLGEDSGADGASGEISSLFLEYLHPEGNAQGKLGRFFLTEGVASDTIDGAFVKATTPVGVGLSLWAGRPVEYSIVDGVERGDSLFGGRLFYVLSGVVEAGFSYLKENGSSSGLDRELYGGDLWLGLGKGFELTGQASYDDDAGKMAQQRYAVRYVPNSTVDVSAGYEYYTYEGLFHAAMNPAFQAPSVDNTDKVGKLFAIVDWAFTPGWTLEIVGKNIQHDRGDPGDANRGEIGLRRMYNNGKDFAGASVAVTVADRDENEYNEYRAFASYSPGKLRLSLDAMAQLFKKEEENAYQVVATAGYQILKALHLSGALIYTRSPLYDEDYMGVVRVSYDLGIRTGGKKK